MEYSLQQRHVPPFFVGEASQLLGGVVGFVGGEAADVGVPLCREVVVVNWDGIDSLAEIVGVALVEFQADGFDAVKDSIYKRTLVGLGEGAERAFNGG